jgi:hypothetical protein
VHRREYLFPFSLALFHRMEGTDEVKKGPVVKAVADVVFFSSLGTFLMLILSEILLLQMRIF